jgi:hypothetical protein
MGATLTQLADGTFPMRTTSRRLGKASIKPKSQTKGKEKGDKCQKSELKSWGMKANPYKLAGAELDRYERYRAVTNSMNK